MPRGTSEEFNAHKGGGAPKGNKNAAKGAAWRNALREVLETYSDDQVAAGTALRVIAEICVRHALAGDWRARQEIAERLDGKVAQELIHTGDDEKPEVRLLING